MPRKIKRKIKFETLYQQILKDNPNFPTGKLENRLINLGIKDLLIKNEISNYGIPFKFVEHFDESTLALAYFVNRFKNEGGTLRVYGIHKLQKGDDKTFSPWITGRGKLFTELQNLVLLMNRDSGRKSEIRRIFVLQDISDIAFFYQSAVNVLSEQSSLGIKLGFLLLNEFGTSPEESLYWRRLISNTLIIEYTPPNVNSPQDEKPNYYFLHDIDRQDCLRDNLPYIHGCLVKWAKSPEKISFNRNSRFTKKDFEKYKTLFENWTEFNYSGIARHTVLNMVREADNKFYNNALLLLCRAFKQYEIETGNNYNKREFVKRLFEFVITPDLMRLEKAMISFETSTVKSIKAVDSTSVKNTLNIHESDPTYRQWLRRSLNRVIKGEGNVKLERIYIIDDTNKKKQEYPALVRNLQYYLDYLNFEISEIKKLCDKHNNSHNGDKSPVEIAVSNYMHAKRDRLKNKIKICVTTSTIIEKYAKDVIKSENLKYLGEMRHYPITGENLGQQLSLLDYLFTEEMIYDFNNPRGDPGELKFDAYLIRKNIELKKERDNLIGFTGIDKLENEIQIKVYRLINVANSILQYLDFYKFIDCEKFQKFSNEKIEIKINGEAKKITLPDKIELIKEDLNKIDTKRTDGSSVLSTRRQLEEIVTELLDYRNTIETNLYDYLKAISDYFFEVLSFMSIEINFWHNDNETDIEEIPPFNQPHFDIVKLKEVISQKIQEKFDRKDKLPEIAFERKEVNSENSESENKKGFRL